MVDAGTQVALYVGYCLDEENFSRTLITTQPAQIVGHTVSSCWRQTLDIQCMNSKPDESYQWTSRFQLQLELLTNKSYAVFFTNAENLLGRIDWVHCKIPKNQHYKHDSQISICRKYRKIN